MVARDVHKQLLDKNGDLVFQSYNLVRVSKTGQDFSWSVVCTWGSSKGYRGRPSFRRSFPFSPFCFFSRFSYALYPDFISPLLLVEWCFFSMVVPLEGFDGRFEFFAVEAHVGSYLVMPV